MTKVKFLDSSTIEVVDLEGEEFTLISYAPVHYTKQKSIAHSLASYFDECFSDDKSSMIYWVLMKTMGTGFAFYYKKSELNVERERIGARIRQLRESRGIEAKHLAVLTNIDAANLCRIEQGRYSVGLDILTKISHALGVRVDLIEV